MNLAFFVSAHGFGHAARASAIISALAKRQENSCSTLFTSVPDWFFSDVEGIAAEFDNESPSVLSNANALNIIKVE